MADISEMHTMQPPAGMDTTGLQWAANGQGLTVSGVLRWRGQIYPLHETWPWPSPTRRIQWQVLLRPDGTLIFVDNSNGWPVEHQRYAMIAHGWLWPEDDPEPWEHVVFVNVMHEGASWDHPDVGHHFTQPDGTHRREHPVRGWTTIRAPHPVPGGGFWPRPGQDPDDDGAAKLGVPSP